MSTNFDTDFMDNNNDVIEANHVAQYAQPINDLEDEVDVLQSQMALKADLGHTHAIGEVVGLQSELDTMQNTSEKGQPSGYASLDASGKVPSVQLPAGGGGGSVSIGADQVGFGDTNGDLISDGNFTFKSDRLGLGLAAATRKLEVRDAGGPQQRLSHDASQYWDLGAEPNGDLKISGPSVSSNLAIGASASNSAGISNVAIGAQAKNLAGDYGVAIGRLSETLDWGIALGFNADAKAGSVALGYNCLTTSSYAHAIGRNAEANNHGVAIGFDATASAFNSVVIGRQSVASGSSSVAIGPQSSATALSALAIGDDAKAHGQHSMAVLGGVANHPYSLAFGRGAQTSASHQAVLGGDIGYISNLYLGNGPQAANPVDTAVNASGAAGADISGGKITLAGGQSTGSATGGSVVIATSPAGSTGTGSNALVDRLVIDGEGRMGLFGAAPVAQSTGWSVNNPSTNKSLDVGSPSLTSLAEVLGTLVDDLKNLGILGA